MHGPTVDVDEGALEKLGILRLEIPVPYLEAGGPVNAYAIEDTDGRYTLFDTGVDTAEGVAALRGEAAQKGVDLRQISRLLISHGHHDHFGNAQMLAEESGASAFIHECDREKVATINTVASLLRRHRPYFQRLGVPAETMDQLQARALRIPDRARLIERARLGTLEDGQLLQFKHFEAVVRHLPGHTPGLVCLHAERERLLFADDHVLARVSPNPLMDLSQGEGAHKFRALSRYVESVRYVMDLELDAVLPGHGPAFRGHRELLQGLLEFYELRQGKLLAHLRAHPMSSVFELLPALFPRRDLGRMVLMLSEVLANLEVLEDQGRVTALDGDIVRYTVAAG